MVINLPGAPVEVVAGVLRRADRRVLICLRPRHLDHGGLWEFPGGKREHGEGRYAALARELKEELNIEITCGVPLVRVTHDYHDKIIDLDVWEISIWEGQEKGLMGQRIQWVSPRELHRYDFPAANGAVVDALNRY